MNWTTDITRDLISAVEERPVLWDTSLDDYSRKNVTSTKWEEVGTLLNCKGVDAKEKWRNTRVYFNSLRRKMLNKKSGQGADESNEPSWEFYKDMSFLLPTLKPKKSQCTLANTTEVKTPSEGQSDFDEMEGVEIFAEHEVLEVMTSNKAMSDRDGQNQFATPTASKENSKPTPLRNRLPIHQRVKQRKESDESEVMMDLMGNVSDALKNHKPKDTADDHFTAHLSCQLSQVPDSAEKERAKIRIMEVLTELKYGKN